MLRGRGALLTNHSEIANKAANLRSHGINRSNNETDEHLFYEQINLGGIIGLLIFRQHLNFANQRLDQFLEKDAILPKSMKPF